MLRIDKDYLGWTRITQAIPGMLWISKIAWANSGLAIEDCGDWVQHGFGMLNLYQDYDHHFGILTYRVSQKKV